MLRFFSRVIDGLLGVALQVSISLVFLGIGASLRLLPSFLRLMRLALRGFLILSFRLYHELFTLAAPFVRRELNVDILVGLPRLAVSLILSFVVGSALFILMGFQLTGFSIALFLLHGLIVGLAWDEIENPNGLQLGVKVE